MPVEDRGGHQIGPWELELKAVVNWDPNLGPVLVRVLLLQRDTITKATFIKENI